MTALTLQKTLTRSGLLAGSLVLALSTAAGCSVEGTPAGSAAQREVETRQSAITLGEQRTQGHLVYLGGHLTLTWIDNFDPRSGYTSNPHVWNVQIDEVHGTLFTQPRMLLNDSDKQANPRVTVNGAGNQALLVYEDTGPSGGGAAINAMYLDSTGAKSGTPFQLEANGGSNNIAPRGAFDPGTGTYLVAYTHSNDTHGVRVTQSGDKSAPFSLNPSGGHGMDIDVFSADGTIGTVQVGPNYTQYLSYLVEPVVQYSRSFPIAGQYQYCQKTMFGPNDVVGITSLYYTGARNGQAFDVRLNLFPYGYCINHASCPPITPQPSQPWIWAGTSTSIGTTIPYSSFTDMRAVVSSAFSGHFLTAVRTQGQDQSGEIRVLSTRPDGTLEGESYVESSCSVREPLGIGIGQSASWLFWSCTGGEIHGLKIDQNANITTTEQVIVP